MTKLVKPQIHMNGTSARDLLDGYVNALNAIREAIIKTQQTGPNGRDYFPALGETFIESLAQHNYRLDRLHRIEEEFETLAEHACDACDKAETAR